MPDDFPTQNSAPPYTDGVGNGPYQRSAGGVGFGRRSTHCASSRLFFAVFLVTAGTLLFLDNIGVLPIHHIWDYWPLIPIAFGIGKFVGHRQPSERLWGVVLVLFGSLFLLINLHLLLIRSWDRSWPVSLLLIVLGVMALIKTLESRNTRVPVGFPAPLSGAVRDSVNESSLMANVKRRVDTTNFSGGDIDALFGSVEVDLRHAQIAAPEKPVQLEIRCFCGSTKIRIPDHWAISIQAPAILGNVEDRTIPPRVTPGMVVPTLLITGQVTLGSIEIEN